MAKEKVPKALSAYLGRIGKKGGKRRLQTMTPEQRSAIAKKAAAKSAEVRAAKAAKKPRAKKPKPEGE